MYTPLLMLYLLPQCKLGMYILSRTSNPHLQVPKETDTSKDVILRPRWNILKGRMSNNSEVLSFLLLRVALNNQKIPAEVREVFHRPNQNQMDSHAILKRCLNILVKALKLNRFDYLFINLFLAFLSDWNFIGFDIVYLWKAGNRETVCPEKL